MFILPCGSLVSLAWVWGHCLGDMDMVSMTIVGVHSVRVRRRSFVCSAADKNFFFNDFKIFFLMPRLNYDKWLSCQEKPTDIYFQKSTKCYMVAYSSQWTLHMTILSILQTLSAKSTPSFYIYIYIFYIFNYINWMVFEWSFNHTQQLNIYIHPCREIKKLKKF